MTGLLVGLAGLMLLSLIQMVRLHREPLVGMGGLSSLPWSNGEWKLGQQQQRHRNGDDNHTAHNNDQTALRLPRLASPNTTTNHSDTMIVLDQQLSFPEDKRVILEVLRAAGVTSIQAPSWELLPDTRTLTTLYGPIDQPIVLGLETCQAFRDAIPQAERYVAPAGMFNTGTNALERHLTNNVFGVQKAWQVPWGKHRTESKRLHHAAVSLEGINQTAVLPIVVIRDPFFWMQSMCKHPYAAKWARGAQRCPGLKTLPRDFRRFSADKLPRNQTSFRVKVIFSATDVQFWDSLVHLWSRWYRDYWEAPYPRLMIRFEDLLLHSDDIVQSIAECVGGTANRNHVVETGTSKNHGSGADFVKAVIKTGDLGMRLKHLTQPDLHYATEHLDAELMQAFRYNLSTVNR
jgi:hypothetical protein